MKAQRERSERGFFTIWTLGLCVIVLFIGGLTMDLWNAFSTWRNLAEIADGAVAGASKIDLQAYRQDDTKIVLQTTSVDGDNETAIDRANAYIDDALLQDGIALSSRDVQVVGQQLVVQLSQPSPTLLSRIFLPDKEITSTVRSAATPQQAQ